MRAVSSARVSTLDARGRALAVHRALLARVRDGRSAPRPLGGRVRRSARGPDLQLRRSLHKIDSARRITANRAIEPRRAAARADPHRAARRGARGGRSLSRRGARAVRAWVARRVQRSDAGDRRGARRGRARVGERASRRRRRGATRGARPVFSPAMGERTYSIEPAREGTVRFTMREKIGGPLFPLFRWMIPSFDESFDRFAADLARAAKAKRG